MAGRVEAARQGDRDEKAGAGCKPGPNGPQKTWPAPSQETGGHRNSFNHQAVEQK
jgi:hypothetical protein